MNSLPPLDYSAARSASLDSSPPLANILPEKVTKRTIGAGLEQGLPTIISFLNPAAIGALAKTCRGLSQRLASDIDWQATRRVLQIVPPSIFESARASSTSFLQIAPRCLRKFAEEKLLQSAQRFNNWLKLPAALTLTELDFTNLKLGSLPPEIGLLSRLDNLILPGNQLDSLPDEIGEIPRLRILDLANNHLSRLPPEIGQLSRLKVLNLDNNQLSSLPPEIRKLSHLIVLILGNNKFTTLPPEIRKLSHLAFLCLDNNKFTTLLPWIGRLPRLVALSLRNNQLTTLPLILRQCSKLIALHLDNNQLSMATLRPSVAAWMRKKRFTLGEQQPRPVLAEAGAGAEAIPVEPSGGKSEESEED